MVIAMECWGWYISFWHTFLEDISIPLCVSLSILTPCKALYIQDLVDTTMLLRQLSNSISSPVLQKFNKTPPSIYINSGNKNTIQIFF